MRVWPVIALAPLVSLAGCGSAEDVAARAAAESFEAAVSASDFAAACELLAPPTEQALAAHEGSCAKGLEAAGLPPIEQITGVSVYSRAAQVRGIGTTTFLVLDAGRWKVLAAGCQEAGTDRPYQCDVEG